MYDKLTSQTSAAFIFALGFAATVFLSLLAPEITYARARLSILPCLAAGGIAVAMALRRRAVPPGPQWLTWWGLGLLAYCIHLGFTVGGLYHWKIAAIIEKQGLLTASVNFALLFLWICSFVIVLWKGRHDLLHWITMALFVVAALVATLVFGSTMAKAVGALLLILWTTSFFNKIQTQESAHG